MPHAVARLEVVQGRPRRGALDGRVNGGGRDVGQKDRPCLRLDLDHVARAIVFLVAPRLLVLLDHVAVVLVDGEAGRDPGLHVIAHLQAIEIRARLVVHDERRLLTQPREVVASRFVDQLRVRIGALGQVDLGARRVKKAERMPGGELSCFVGGDDVVGNSSDVRRRVGRRAERAERNQ